MELLLHQWGDWPELYRNTDKTEATKIVIIDSQMNYRGKLDTYRAFDMSLSRYKGNRCSYIENFFSKTEFGFYGFIILLIIGIAAAIMNTKV